MLNYHWIIQVFVVVTLSLLFDLIQKKIFTRISKKKHNFWMTTFIEAAPAPLSLLIWIIGICFAADIIENETSAAIFSAIPSIRKVVGIGAISWFLIRLIGRGEQNLTNVKDKTTADAIGKILRASVFITTGLVILQSLGFSVSYVLTFGGLSGIAIGFAAKDMLANFFGAFMIYWDRPFKVGDWVRSEEKEIEGYVEQIGWRLTKIRSFEKRPIYVPNSLFSTITLVNVTRMTHRRIKETIGVCYADVEKVNKITNEIEQMLTSHTGIDETQFLVVNFHTFGHSSLDILVYCFTHATGWKEHLRVKQEILLKINSIISSHGAQIAFPTTTLHLPSDRASLEGLIESKVSLPSKKL